MTRILLLFFSLLLATNISAQQEYSSLDYKNYQKALDVFELLDEANYNQIDSLNCNLSGIYHYMDHFQSPRQRQVIILSNRYNGRTAMLY